MWRKNTIGWMDGHSRASISQRRRDKQLYGVDAGDKGMLQGELINCKNLHD
jgi:hypothetical protein